MILALAVAVAAGVGALLRYVVDMVVQHRTRGEFPSGTLIVNVSGSLLLGIVTGLSLHHGLGSDTVAVVGVGIAGGYTTLSTWAWESFALTGDGAPGLAVANVLGSLALGLAAAAAGLGLALV